jgi:hypothetical protein
MFISSIRLGIQQKKHSQSLLIEKDLTSSDTEKYVLHCSENSSHVSVTCTLVFFDNIQKIVLRSYLPMYGVESFSFTVHLDPC